MSLFRRLADFGFARGLGSAWRAAAAVLLLAALVQPGAAPVVAAPAAVVQLAPQGCPINVTSVHDSGTLSLRDAVACASAGDTVTLDASLVNATLYVTSTEIAVTVPITIDGSLAPGAKVEALSHNRVFNINTIGTVTLKALTLQHGNAASGNGGAVLANNNVVFDQVQVLSSTAPSGMGGGLYANSTATLTGTQFISNTSFSDGGAAWVNFTTVVTNGRFERNMCTGPGVGSGCQGGGLNPGPLTLTGTQFISNTSAGQGGGLYAFGTASLTNGTLQGNQCTDSGCQGGGLYANSTLTLNGTDFISNTAVSLAGGAWANTAAVVTNGHFQGNKCTDISCQVGGLVVSTTLALTGTQFISNTSANSGGAAIVLGNAVLTNARFERNTCTASNCQGGGLFAGTHPTDTLTLHNTDFISNSSTSNGGGAFGTGNVVLTGGSFQGNKCTGAFCTGGGLHAGTYATSTLTLNGTQFISNTSTLGGGGLVAGAATLTNGRFERNVCNQNTCNGGGLYVASLTLTGTQFITNSSISYGGGAVVQGAAVVTNASFQGNKCSDSACAGGGLATGGAITLTATDFISNTSGAGGGGAFGTGNVALTNGSFRGNKCTGTACTGGGLVASGALTLSGTQFISNTSSANGGGLATGGSAVLTNGRFERNICTHSGCLGGGLYVPSLTLTGTQFITNSSISHGGGALVLGPAVVTNASFQGNQCSDSACQGGGLAAAGAITLTATDFISNTSSAGGGGVYASTTLLVTNGTFERNRCTQSGCSGGGLVVELSADVRMSSFSGNQSAGSGGGIGITNSSQITLANVTLSGNLATTAGGGLFANSGTQANLFNVTVADNQAASGGGVWVNPAATVGISNTIFSNNGFGNCSGPVVSGTHNLEWPGSDCAAASPGAGFTTADPRLAPLAQNPPGTTLTRALLLGSAARDAGDPATCAAAPVNNVDQRGMARPIRGLPGPGAAICDIGAYEAAAMVPFLWLPVVRK